MKLESFWKGRIEGQEGEDEKRDEVEEEVEKELDTEDEQEIEREALTGQRTLYHNSSTSHREVRMEQVSREWKGELKDERGMECEVRTR